MGRAGADTTSLGLLARVKAHEPGSWDKLVDLYTPLLFSWCRKSGMSEVDTQDVGQEVFKAVFRKIGAFHRDRDGDSFRAWLRTITQRKIADHVNKRGVAQAAGGSDARSRMEKLPADDATDQSDEALRADERRILLRQVLKQLEPSFKKETWQAFWLVAAEGQNPKQVAIDLGMTINSVYLAKSRILHRIREEFGGLIEV